MRGRHGSHYRVAHKRVNQPHGPGAAEGVPPASSWRGWIDPKRLGGLHLLLVFVPVAVILRLAHAPALWQFLASGLAIVPLAGMMGEATEQLANRLGPGIGGLLNATFGNAAELIIALFAMSRGLDDVVKASLTGSVIGNLLLVLGASLFAGGLKYRVQHFNKTAAGVGGTLMVLAAIGMVVPGLFHHLIAQQGGPPRLEHKLSAWVAVVLIITYGLNLLFSLRTHKDLYNPGSAAEATHALATGGAWGVRRSTGVLLAATAAVAVMSEILVGAVEETSRSLGLTEVFVGVIVVAIIGNAAEHSTAVLMALKNQMDLAVGIALGSALQIAMFVAPVLVLASHFRGSGPMDLVFTTMEVVAVILAVIIARMVAEDGESNWLEGAMLLMIYAILGLAFFFLPEPHHRAKAGPAPAPAAAGDLRDSTR